MGKPRLFSTAPVSAMRDTELTALDWRVLLWVSLHDGMSLVKGKGAGCIASNKTLFANVGCDYSAGCRALSKLVERGHLIRDKHGRATRYRVVFPDADNLPTGNTLPPCTSDQAASDGPSIYDQRFSEARANQPKTGVDYILLSSGIDSSEEGELNSVETTQPFPFAPSGYDVAAPSWRSAGKETNPAEAGLGSGWALKPHLPQNWSRLPVGAQVSRIDRAFSEIGRNSELLADEERRLMLEFLSGVFDDYCGGELDSVAQQALRLSEDLAAW